MASLINVNTKGKSSKEIKEAFINLRASFHVVSKQLDNSKQARKELVSENFTLKRSIQALNNKVDKLQESKAEAIKTLKKEHRDKNLELSREITALNKRVNSLLSKIEQVRANNVRHINEKSKRAARIGKLQESIKLKNRQLVNKNLVIKRLRNKPAPAPKVKVVKEKVHVTKVVKEPLPDKIHNLLTENTLTKSRLDLILVMTALNRFSDITKLSVNQILLLLEARSLNYFKSGQILNYSLNIIRELEAKGLVEGDRAFSKNAVGWYITQRGKQVAEAAYKMAIDTRKLKSEYLTIKEQ